MSEVEIPEHIKSMYNALVKCAPDCGPFFVEYEIFIMSPSSLQPNCYIILFLPEIEAVEGFELYIQVSPEVKTLEVFYADDHEYVRTEKYEGDYGEVPYPSNIEQFIRGLFEDIYSEIRLLDDIRGNSLVSTRND